jgi:hypothetical protein
VPAIADAFRGLASFIDSAPPPLLMLAMVVLTLPLHALIHELGHAGAALALRPGRVAVSVGAERPLVACAMGRMTIAFNPLVLPWRVSAACAYKTPSSQNEAALIAIAGPAASIATCILAWETVGRVDPGLLHAALWAWTLVSFVAAIANLVPYTFTDSRGHRGRSDGATILAALR